MDTPNSCFSNFTKENSKPTQSSSEFQQSLINTLGTSTPGVPETGQKGACSYQQPHNSDFSCIYRYTAVSQNLPSGAHILSL